MSYALQHYSRSGLGLTGGNVSPDSSSPRSVESGTGSKLKKGSY